ncbi:hypothetical protein V1282_006911 [Nitrobacteraceae bacterium AZCC 2146]
MIKSLLLPGDEDRRGLQRHVVFALIVAALCSCESWMFGSLSWVYGYGSGLETIPAYLALDSNDRNFSLWSPFVAGGIDRLAFWGNADPISIELLLFKLLPIWLANGLHRFLQYFVAVFFATRVGKEQLGLDWRWSAFLGLLHGAFAYQTTGALLTIAGVPLLVWLLDRVTAPNRSWIAAVVAGALFSLCTTFTFSDPYLLLFAAMWLIIVSRRYSFHVARQFALFSIALLLADCPQLFAIAANGPTSHRAGWPSEQIGWSIDGLFYRQLQFDVFSQNKLLDFITLNVPPVIFLLGLPLAAFGGWRTDQERYSASMFLRVFAIWAVLSQKWLWILVQTMVALALPFVNGVYMGRFFQIPAAFVLACGLTLAGRMLWLRMSRPALRRGVAAVAIGFAAFMIVWPKVHLFYPLGVNDWGERNYRITALDDIRAKEAAPFRVASVLPLQPAYAYAQGLETVDGWANLYPAFYRDLWYRALTPLFAELPYTRGVFGVDTGRPEDNFVFLGADLIQPVVGLLPGEDVVAALKAGFDVDRRFNINILRLLNVKYLLSEYPLQGQGIALVHAPDAWPDFPVSRNHNTGLVQGPTQDIPGGRFQFLKTYARPLFDLANAWKRDLRGKDIFIYAIDGVRPRFRMVESVAVESSGKAVLDRLARSRSNEAVLEQADVKTATDGYGEVAAGDVDIVRYTPDEIVLDLKHSGKGFLVIANTWSPYWNAEVDGRTAPLLRTNYAQYGLAIGDGDRRVRLYYDPPYAPARLFARSRPEPSH